MTITISDLKYAHWLSLEDRSDELSRLLDQLMARMEKEAKEAKEAEEALAAAKKEQDAKYAQDAQDAQDVQFLFNTLFSGTKLNRNLLFIG